MFETKCIKSGGKSQFSFSFLTYTVNEVRRKLHMVGKQSTVRKRAKRMPDTTVETTAIAIVIPIVNDKVLDIVLKRH